MTDRDRLTEALEWAVIYDRRDNTGHVLGRAAETSRVIRRAATAMRDFPTDEMVERVATSVLTIVEWESYDKELLLAAIREALGSEEE